LDASLFGERSELAIEENEIRFEPNPFSLASLPRKVTTFFSNVAMHVPLESDHLMNRTQSLNV